MISKLGRQITVTSMTKAINKAKIYGDIDIAVINLYTLYIYYIEFTDGKEEYEIANLRLKELISALKYKYPKILCNYKLIVDNPNVNVRTENTAPEVDDKTIDINGSYSHNFTIDDFTTNYTDAETDPYNNITIYPPSVVNFNDVKLFILRLNNSDIQNQQLELEPIINPMEIHWSDVSNIKFIPNLEEYMANLDVENISQVNYSFNFRISDISSFGSLYSSLATITIINGVYQVNLPATIGDIVVNAPNRTITTLTLSMFTTQMAPPYNDPENDDIDAIRIDSISTANKGVFYFDNNPVQAGDIITKQQLIDGLFTHEGANIDTLTGDGLTFSARDSGSMIWVQ